MIFCGLGEQIIDFPRASKGSARSISRECLLFTQDQLGAIASPNPSTYKDKYDDKNHHRMDIVCQESCCISPQPSHMYHVSAALPLMPPAMVYATTPTGNKKQAAAVGIPVKDVTTAEPPGTIAMSVTFHLCGSFKKLKAHQSKASQ